MRREATDGGRPKPSSAVCRRGFPVGRIEEVKAIIGLSTESVPVPA